MSIPVVLGVFTLLGFHTWHSLHDILYLAEFSLLDMAPFPLALQPLATASVLPFCECDY